MRGRAETSGSVHQAGGGQLNLNSSNNNVFYLPPPGHSAAAAAADGAAADRSRAHRRRHIVLAAAIAAIVGAVATYAVIDGRIPSGTSRQPDSSPDGTPGGGPQVGGDRPRATGPTAEPEEETGAPSPSSARPEPSVQWSGIMVLGLEGKELDDGQPTKPSQFDYGDLGLGLGSRASGGLDVLPGSAGAVSLWRTDGELPDYGSCAGTVEAAAASSVPVRPGTVLCVKTDGGRVARLRATRTPEGVMPTVEFDAVVWGPPPGASADR
ncbi:hypothetical protein [Streptomyces sp. NPDC018833]|uniref:hypothetical protein n=1 Tax=Streptomyces sp. NPDC018833 TaxID=3365053 RepID=UPI0037A3C029